MNNPLHIPAPTKDVNPSGIVVNPDDPNLPQGIDRGRIREIAKKLHAGTSNAEDRTFAWQSLKKVIRQKHEAAVERSRVQGRADYERARASIEDGEAVQ